MVLALGIIIFIIGCCMSSYDNDSYNARCRDEQRYNELKQLLNERQNNTDLPKRTKQIRRRFIKDKYGNILGEEILEEVVED